MNEQPIDLIFERSANEIRRSHAGTIQDFALANSCNATDRLIAEVERLRALCREAAEWGRGEIRREYLGSGGSV